MVERSRCHVGTGQGAIDDFGTGDHRHTGRTLKALIALGTRNALSTLGSGSTGQADGTLRARGAGCSCCTVGAGRTIGSVQTIGAGDTRVTLRASGSGDSRVTLRASGTGCSCCTIGSVRTIGTIRTIGSGDTGVTLRSSGTIGAIGSC